MVPYISLDKDEEDVVIIPYLPCYQCLSLDIVNDVIHVGMVLF